MEASDLTSGKKILAVDDERHIVRLIQVNLEHAGYQVATAVDGYEALEKVRADRPDMVVLDVKMPYLDGFEVLRHLRADPATSCLPVVMLTSNMQGAVEYQMGQMPCEGYLTKPFSPAELIACIEQIFPHL